jgi:hypothetical protein
MSGNGSTDETEEAISQHLQGQYIMKGHAKVCCLVMLYEVQILHSVVENNQHFRGSCCIHSWGLFPEV